MIGARTDKDGKAITGAGKPQVIVGINVPGNIILGLAIAKNKDGSMADGKNGKMARASMLFEQANGSVFSHTFFDSDKDWGQDKLTLHLLHVSLPFLGNDPERFYAIVGEHSDGSFVSVIQALATQVFAKPIAEKTKISMKLLYAPNKEGDFFASFPKYLNWIELDGTTPSTLREGEGDIYVRPERTTMADATATTGAGTATDGAVGGPAAGTGAGGKEDAPF